MTKEEILNSNFIFTVRPVEDSLFVDQRYFLLNGTNKVHICGRRFMLGDIAANKAKKNIEFLIYWLEDTYRVSFSAEEKEHISLRTFPV